MYKFEALSVRSPHGVMHNTKDDDYKMFPFSHFAQWSGADDAIIIIMMMMMMMAGWCVLKIYKFFFSMEKKAF